MSNDDIMEYGETVMVSSSLTAKEMEELMKKVLDRCDQPISWRSIDGKMEVKALGSSRSTVATRSASGPHIASSSCTGW